MIPAGFEYHRPADIASALSLLQTHGDEARVIAGGHSLIPMMKLRMADLSHLIDLQDIDGLKGITIADDIVSIGAMTTQNELITNDELARRIPILREAALLIADPQVRYVGTVGGNVANGDPGNDMPGLMQCLGAVYTLEGPEGSRAVAARDFYEAAYFTAREDEEILTQITIPLPSMSGFAYEKQKRKIGDYATAAAAVMVGGGNASVAMTNLSDTPIYSAEASDALAKGDVDGCVAAALDAIDPQEDMRGPIAFKKHVAEVILRRAIAKAQERAA
ncbi:MAG: xanthine dehydrogenase family protein subunit M [Thalassococcus sp.]|uniref:FAD binding domain-containing protein n=1 Tax=Thalassococcus sp. TaxID=1928858 RepID=UPI001B240B7E|nr:xanthine dehydrogenase family protein subunit M [Thalassococcus sp.]MBO6867141.1 xanthine dehydrogenase family protein subunit M [Thalassococcus sp.]